MIFPNLRHNITEKGKKIHAIDNGISNKVAFRFSEDKGRLLENIVFIELKRQQKEVHFHKTKTGKEVDFLYFENNVYHLFQIAYDINDKKTMLS